MTEAGERLDSSYQPDAVRINRMGRCLMHQLNGKTEQPSSSELIHSSDRRADRSLPRTIMSEYLEIGFTGTSETITDAQRL